MRFWHFGQNQDANFVKSGPNPNSIKLRDESIPALLQLDFPPVVQRRLDVRDRRRGQRRRGERDDAVEGGDFLAEDLDPDSIEKIFI